MCGESFKNNQKWESGGVTIEWWVVNYDKLWNSTGHKISFRAKRPDETGPPLYQTQFDDH